MSGVRYTMDRLCADRKNTSRMDTGHMNRTKRQRGKEKAMPFSVVHHDITDMQVDALVNAANTDLLMGGGVCGAIFRTAGASRMQEACDRLSPIRTGEAVITPGFDLPARYVIHTAGPLWRGGDHNEEALLRSCYRSCLAIASVHGCTSMAFPLISAGIYGYPRAEALDVAEDEIRYWLKENDSTMDVKLALWP